MRQTPFNRLSGTLVGRAKSPESIIRNIQWWFQQVARIINGNISFGNATGLSTTGSRDPSQNIDGVWVSVTFAAPNTNQVVTHNLFRLPVGYIPVEKVAACDVYDGSPVAKTTTQITLKGTVATTVTLFIF
jgi:hypothetical protein